MAKDDLIYINGINAASGDYDFPPMSLDDMAQLAQGETLDNVDELRKKHEEKTQAHWAVKEGVDPKDLAQTGWGVIFAFADKDKTPAIKEALKPLLDWRRSQAAKLKENRYKEYIGPAAYRPKETKNAFLSRHGMGPGPADPDKIPYYLLIVGDPDAIPYKVQYQLDVQYAVGRIHFDNVEDYAKYAHNVVLSEQKSPFLNPKAAFFGVANADDRATNLSAEKLIKPLADHIAADQPKWGVKTHKPAECTKAQLDALLNGGKDETALLVAASHGMGFPNGDPLQLRHQGALLCQDWPGPSAHKGAIPDKFYFSGDDLSANANLLGLIAFFFACYGGGTPLEDEFAHKDGKRLQIAPKPFLANLPRRMLQQGALAVFAHVERAWGTSFMWDKGIDNTETFKSSLKRLLEGAPMGNAFEYFNERYAELSSELSVILEEVQFGAEPDKEDLVQKWTANNDARSFVVIGDPAVRLPVPFMGGAPKEKRPGLATALAPFAVAPAPAADPMAAAQANMDALTSQIQSKVKEAIESASGVQREGDVKTNPADVAFDSGKGVMTGTAQLATTARLDPTGKSGSWDVQVEIKVTAKKK
jgi:hypothetical protein